MLAVAVIERYNPVFNSQHQKKNKKNKTKKNPQKPKNQKKKQNKKQTKQFVRLHHMALTLEEALERTRFSLLSKEVEVAEFQLGCSWERIRAHFRGEGVGTHSQKAKVG